MPSRPRSLRVEAVVLRHADWGEADRLLWLLTRQEGKRRAVAKGVRKIRSRKAGHLEPFTHVTLQLARGRDLFIVTQAETIEAFLPLRTDLRRIGLASYVVELADRFTYEEGEGAALFPLVLDTLRRLAAGADDARLVLRYYDVRLLDLVGYRPQLFECVRCGAAIQPENQFFAVLEGGVVCPRCGAHDRRLRPVSLAALKYLRHFQRSAYAQARRARPTDAVWSEMDNLMQAYLTAVLERRLHSTAFLRRLQGED